MVQQASNKDLCEMSEQSSRLKKKKIVVSTVYQTTADRMLVICNDENKNALLLAGRICTGCCTGCCTH